MAVLEAHTGRDEVGHTPASPAGLVTAMRSEGFADDELVDAGLAHRDADGRITDFYRQRVLIPIRDQESRICGFVGRNVGDDRWPKYKNPPRTHAYDKSVNLYQPLPAPTAGRWGQVVVVEGTLDAMAIAVAAIRSGTAGQFCPVTQSGRELSAETAGAGSLPERRTSGACIRWRRSRPGVGASPCNGSGPPGPCRVGHNPAGRSRPGLLVGGERRQRAQGVGGGRCA